MKKSYLSLLFLNYFSTGIIVPVLSLMLIDRSCTLPQIALLFGLYSLTVFILELPSGVLSDIIGRKAVFLLSCSFNLAASFSILFLSGFAQLIPAMIILGAGRAFSTGSLDALLIDSYFEAHGSNGLSKATSAIALLETTGISAGTILGGFLPSLSGRIASLGSFDLNLIVRTSVYAAITLLTLLFIREAKKAPEQRISLKNHLLTSLRFLKSSPTVILLALSLMLSGLFIAPVEAYWQPAYTSLMPDNSLLFTVGLLSFGTFAFAALGTLFAKRFVLSSESRLGVKFTVFRLLLFAVFIFLSFQHNIIAFGGVFILMYFLFSGSEVIASTMLNLQVPASLRASMLSLVSLFFQAGCMLSPLFSSTVVAKASVSSLWLYLGIALIVLTLITGPLLIRQNRKSAAISQYKDAGSAQ